MVSGKGCGILLLLGLILGGCCGPTLVSDDELRGLDIRPYRGLVRNFADVDISVPSLDSDAIIIVPAQGAVEYTVWQPNFTLVAFVNGKEVYCRRIQVAARQHTIFCKKYDFLAEIYPETIGFSGARRGSVSAVEPALQPKATQRSQKSASG
mgnify:CR=1 FL=1